MMFGNTPDEMYSRVSNTSQKPVSRMQSMMGDQQDGDSNKKGSIELPIDDDTLFRLFMLTTVIANVLIIFRNR